MSIIVKPVDPSVHGSNRATQFSTASSDFVVADILDIETSLGRAAARVEIAAAADATVTVRFNAMHKRYAPMQDAANINLPVKDLSQETTWYDTNLPTYTVEAGETYIIDDIPVRNIQVTALTAGATTGVVVTAR